MITQRSWLLFLLLCFIQLSEVAEAQTYVKSLYKQELTQIAPSIVASSANWINRYFSESELQTRTIELTGMSLQGDDFAPRQITVRKIPSQLTVFLVPKNTIACNFTFVEYANQFKNRFTTKVQVYDAEVAHFEYAYTNCNLAQERRLGVKIRYRYAKALKDACLFAGYWDCAKPLEIFRGLIAEACEQVNRKNCMEDRAEFDKVISDPAVNPLLEGTGVTVANIWDGAAQILQQMLTDTNNDCTSGSVTQGAANATLAIINDDMLTTAAIRKSVNDTLQFAKNSKCAALAQAN